MAAAAARKFVLVPGSHHGSWWFEPLTRQLRRRGHDVYPLTLTGVGERNHLLTASVNLDTHVDDVVRVLKADQIDDALLVGWSYGGMVITGVVERAPESVDTLVYLDAFVPEDGDSVWSLSLDAERHQYIQKARVNGYAIAPPSIYGPRATSHPLASWLQSIHLTGALERVRRRDFVYASGRQVSAFTSVYERLRDNPTWNVHTLPTGHNFMIEAPDEVLKIVLKVAE